MAARLQLLATCVALVAILASGMPWDVMTMQQQQQQQQQLHMQQAYGMGMDPFSAGLGMDPYSMAMATGAGNYPYMGFGAGMGYPTLPNQPQQPQWTNSGYDSVLPLSNPYSMLGANPYMAAGLGFGYGYGLPTSQAAPAPANKADAAVPSKSSSNYLWVCLEDIFPPEVRLQAGIPEKAGEILGSYATHAYVMLGSSPQTSTAWQLQLAEGAQYWASVLMESRNVDMKDPVSWGLKRAQSITGSTKISQASGSFVYGHSKKCFRSKEPSTCSSQEINSFASQYKQQHPRFNLANDNCALFACSVLSHCSGGEAHNCDAKQCMNNLVVNPMTAKDPQCDTSTVLDRVSASHSAVLSIEQSTTTPNRLTSNDNALPAANPTELAEMMPMHTTEASEILAQMLAKEKQKPVSDIGS